MKRNITIIILLFSTIITFAQQSNTLFYMHRLPQSTLVNPAIQPDCKLTISGLAIPVSGQLFPAMHTNTGSTGFAYKDMVQYNSVLDSLLIPTSKDYDYEHILGKLKDVNFITFEEHLDIISVGYKWKNNWRFTFNIASKTEIKLNFTKDLMQLIYEGGNGATFSEETADISFGITATQWHEIGIGASKKINDKLTVGGTIKLLFGQSNIWSKKTNLEWSTDPTDYTYNIHADMEMYTSQSFYKVDKYYYDYEADSMVFDGESLNPSTKEFLFSFKNPGSSIDLGAEYKFNDKIKLYASVIDLGFIKWNNNVNVFTVDGKYKYDGYDIQPLATENDSIIDAHNTALQHEVINIFLPERQVDSYYSYLTPKFHIGGTYQFNEKINAGILYRADVYSHKLHSALTLSGNANITKWFSAYLSYSMMYNNYTNVGVGLVAKGSIFQFFVVTDNIWGYIWPQSARVINGRLGINLVFGCKKNNSATLVGSSDL